MAIIGRNNQAQYYEPKGDVMPTVKPMSAQYGLLGQPKNDRYRFDDPEAEVGLFGNSTQYNFSMANITNQMNQWTGVLENIYAKYGKDAMKTGTEANKMFQQAFGKIQELQQEKMFIENYKGTFESNYKGFKEDDIATRDVKSNAAMTGGGFVMVNGNRFDLGQAQSQYQLDQREKIKNPKIEPLEIKGTDVATISRSMSIQNNMPLFNPETKQPIEYQRHIVFNDNAIMRELISSPLGKISISSGDTRGFSSGDATGRYTINTHGEDNRVALSSFISSLRSNMFSEETNKWFENQFVNHMKSQGSIPIYEMKEGKLGEIFIEPKIQDGEQVYSTNIADPMAYQSFKIKKIADLNNIKLEVKEGNEVGAIAQTTNNPVEEIQLDEEQEIIAQSFGDPLPFSTFINRYRPQEFVSGIAALRAVPANIKENADNYLTTISEIGSMNSNDPDYNNLIKKADRYYDILMHEIKTEVKSGRLPKTVVDRLLEKTNTNIVYRRQSGSYMMPIGVNTEMVKSHPITTMKLDRNGTVTPVKTYSYTGSAIKSEGQILQTDRVFNYMMDYDATVNIDGKPVRYADSDLFDRTFHNNKQAKDAEFRSKNTKSYVERLAVFDADKVEKELFDYFSEDGKHMKLTIPDAKKRLSKNEYLNFKEQNKIYTKEEIISNAKVHKSVLEQIEKIPPKDNSKYFIYILTDYINAGYSGSTTTKTSSQLKPRR